MDLAMTDFFFFLQRDTLEELHIVPDIASLTTVEVGVLNAVPNSARIVFALALRVQIEPLLTL